MEITEDIQFRAELLKKIREREFSERTGIHMSDLNYCLNKQALRKFKPREDTDQETLIYSIGWATQRWLTSMDEDEPEKEVDGIKVTCDALIVGDSINPAIDLGLPVSGDVMETFIPWELKATYQSSNRPIEENIHWIRQIECQCYVQGTTEAYLTRFELLGDWGSVYPKGKSKEERDANRKLSARPTLHAYKLSFTQEELDKNWQWFKDRRELFVKMLETKELLRTKVLALPPGGSWECGYCSYKEECNDLSSKSNS